MNRQRLEATAGTVGAGSAVFFAEAANERAQVYATYSYSIFSN